MEAGYRAARDGDEQNREQRLSVYNKAVKRRQLDGRVGKDYAQNAAGNHAQKQEHA